MTREHLYRGKTIDGEWIYGDLAHLWNRFPFIMPNCTFARRDLGYDLDNEKEVNQMRYSNELALGAFIEVIPDSVGQYTGLMDKNGNKLFNGDFTKFHYFYQGFVDYGAVESEKEIIGEIQILPLGLYLKCQNDDDSSFLNYYEIHEESFEIIGNTTDHPDLLKQ